MWLQRYRTGCDCGKPQWLECEDGVTGAQGLDKSTWARSALSWQQGCMWSSLVVAASSSGHLSSVQSSSDATLTRQPWRLSLLDTVLPPKAPVTSSTYAGGSGVETVCLPACLVPPCGDDGWHLHMDFPGLDTVNHQCPGQHGNIATTCVVNYVLLF